METNTYIAEYPPASARFERNFAGGGGGGKDYIPPGYTSW